MTEQQRTLYRRSILRMLQAFKYPMTLAMLVEGLEINFEDTDAGECLVECKALAEGRYVELGRQEENRAIITISLLEAGRVLIAGKSGV